MFSAFQLWFGLGRFVAPASIVDRSLRHQDTSERANRGFGSRDMHWNMRCDIRGGVNDELSRLLDALTCTFGYPLRPWSSSLTENINNRQHAFLHRLITLQ
ncbi:hypothetical protein K491DRAFT_675107 [Lophiostoma macrostomum CBS 122681]|uniref:Uncharacterized protein n=1 Tax=Lophiostoma macrostomum CBS 122681 TaxID=1314788 RepID=A0A6A6TMD8_9PLEO|nr:hypothetical protein K491DRAFT_675107 [Lophiostoma macrostomum CBS 122681]